MAPERVDVHDVFFRYLSAPGLVPCNNQINGLTVPEGREHATRVQYLARVFEVIHSLHHDFETLLDDGLQPSHIRHTEIGLESRATLAMQLMVDGRGDGIVHPHEPGETGIFVRAPRSSRAGVNGVVEVLLGVVSPRIQQQPFIVERKQRTGSIICSSPGEIRTMGPYFWCSSLILKMY